MSLAAIATWLFTSRTGKIVLALVAFVVGSGAVAVWKTRYDARRRREGADKALREVDKEGREAENAMRDTEKPRDEKDTLNRLDGGTF